MNQTNWLPGILAFAAAAVGAVVYLLTRSPAASTPDGGVADDLAARYQRLLGELKEHRANQHLLPKDVWEREQARLEQAAAAVLRERDNAKHEQVKAEARAEKKAQAAAQATGFAAQNPGLVGALIGGAVVAFFVILGLKLSGATQERQDGMSATGAQPGGGPMATPRAPEEDPKLRALAEQVRSNPEDIEAVVGLGMRLISLQGFAEAKPLFARAALLDPYHVKGRVGRAVLRAVDGEVAAAQDELEALADRYPEAYDGHLYSGLIALDANDLRRGVHQLELYVNTAPASEQPPMIRMEVERMKQELQQGP